MLGNADHDMLTQAHFEPGEVAYLFDPSFTRDDLKAALFESRLDRPKALAIRLELPEPMNTLVETHVVVRRVDLVYIYETVDGKRQPCDNRPDWYVEGELLETSAYGPASTAVRIYVIDGERSGHYGDAYIQRIPMRPIDPNGVIETDEAYITH